MKRNLESDTAYNIDGEIYEKDNILVTLLPGLVNFIGNTVEIDRN